MDIWKIVASVAIVCTSMQMFPQIVKTVRTKHVRDLSLWLCIIISCGSGCWFFYGMHIKDVPIIIANFINVVGALILVVMKFRYSEQINGK